LPKPSSKRTTSPTNREPTWWCKDKTISVRLQWKRWTVVAYQVTTTSWWWNTQRDATLGPAPLTLQQAKLAEEMWGSKWREQHASLKEKHRRGERVFIYEVSRKCTLILVPLPKTNFNLLKNRKKYWYVYLHITFYVLTHNFVKTVLFVASKKHKEIASWKGLF
jgi:hypothetical protein